MKKTAGLTALPLGGVGECGSLNMMVYECDGDMIVVDAGIGFPTEYTPGIDVIVPDVTYIRENIERLKGIFITHGHEDHIGALHYIWEEMKAPVYLTKFSKMIFEEKLASVGLAGQVPVKEVKSGDKIKLGNFEVEYVDVNHSVPDASSLMIRTKHGNIVHTGDYTFEENVPIGALPDMEKRLTKIGDEGILAMFGDSTDSGVEGHGGDESTVSQNLHGLFSGFENRIYACIITSNIARMYSVMDAAIANGRKIAIYGFSMRKRYKNGVDCGYIPPNFTKHVIDIEEAMTLPKNKVMVILTGCQAQSRAALARLGRNDMPNMTLDKGDMVVLSSLWIPGNEREIGNMTGNLARRGAEVHHMKNNRGIYASGHPYKDDVMKMYKAIRPQISVPVHGNHLQMEADSKLSKSLGVKQQITLENGQKLHIAPGKSFVHEEEFPVGRNYIDGYNILDADRFILRDRIKLSETGVASVSLVISKLNGEIIEGPVIKTKGLIDESVQGNMLKIVRKEVFKTLHREFKNDKITNKDRAEEMTRQAVRRAFQKERGRKPVTVVSVIEV